jgi:hypothetical protein
VPLPRRSPPDFVFVPATEAEELRALAGPSVSELRGALNFESVTRYLPPDMEAVEYVKVPAWLLESASG